MTITATLALRAHRRGQLSRRASGWTAPAYRENSKGSWVPAQAIEFDIKTPKDYRSYADRIKVAYEQVNRGAADDEGWRAQYAAFLKFYAEVQDASWFSLSDTTYEELRQWERRLADWQARLKSKGVDVGPMVRPPDSGGATGALSNKAAEVADSIGSAVKLAVTGLAIYTGVQLARSLRG